MLYALLHRLARIALRWYYRDVEILGAELVPEGVPMLVVANHPNAVVDPMLAATTLPRRLTFTGKATLFENPFLRAFLRAVGMVPLRRASDERKRRDAVGRDAVGRDAGGRGAGGDPSRNADAFRAVIAALAARKAVLIFPEGKSHDDPAIAPLKTGTARMALQARAAGVRDVAILPLGFVFEDKARPRTRILVEVGEPLRLDAWVAGRDAATDAATVDALTAEIDRRIRALTVNFETATAAADVAHLARVLAAEGHGPLGSGARWADTIAVTRRVDAARRLLEAASPSDPGLAVRAATLRERLHAVERRAAAHRLDLRDTAIDTSLGSAAAFALREGAIAVAAAPLALVGRVVHWPAVTVARWVARRTSTSDADPAMQTITTGAPLVLLTWLLLAALAWRAWGPVAALVTLAALPALALCDVAVRDRAARARARMRAFFTFRREPALQRELLLALADARNEAAAIEESIGVQGRGGQRLGAGG